MPKAEFPVGLHLKTEDFDLFCRFIATKNELK